MGLKDRNVKATPAPSQDEVLRAELDAKAAQAAVPGAIPTGATPSGAPVQDTSAADLSFPEAKAKYGAGALGEIDKANLARQAKIDQEAAAADVVRDDQNARVQTANETKVNVLRRGTNDSNDIAMPASFDPDGEKAKAAGKPVIGETRTNSSSRTIVQHSQEAIDKQNFAAATQLEAANVRAQAEGEHAGLAQETLQLFKDQIKAHDDATSQLRDAAIAQQQERMNSISEMLAAGANRAADPTAFFTSQGESAGFGAAIATAAGHLASALGGGPNAALNTITQAVERNLRMQQFNIARADRRDEQVINLMDRWNSITQDQIQAREATKLSLLQQADYQMKIHAQRLEGKLSDVRYQETKGAIAQQIADIQRNLDEMNKRQVHSQVVKSIPLVQSDEARQMQEMARREAQAPQPTSVQSDAGPTVLSSALGTRVAFDANATTEEGVPSMLARPQEVVQRGPGQLEVEGTDQRQFLQPFTLQDIQQQAADAYEPDPRDPPELQEQKREEAIISASRTAALEERRALLEEQSKTSIFTDQELRERWERSDVLKNVVPDWRYLKLDDERVDIGAHGRTYNITDAGKEMRGTEGGRTRWWDANQAFGYGIDWMYNAENTLGLIEKLGAHTGISLGEQGGPIDIAALTPENAADVARIQDSMVQAVNVARAAFEGKALNGPGEWETFKKIVGQPSEWENIAALLMQNPQLAVEKFKIMQRNIHDWNERSRRKMGLYSVDEIVGGNPHNLEGGKTENLR